MNTPTKFKILIINDSAVADIMKGMLEKSDTRIEVLTCPDKLIPGNWYHPSTAEVERLAHHIEETNADLIIIGNNMGTGIAISRTLSSDSRKLVVVFYHLPPLNPNYVQQYKEMGITRYQSRTWELEKVVTELLST